MIKDGLQRAGGRVETHFVDQGRPEPESARGGAQFVFRPRAATARAAAFVCAGLLVLGIVTGSRNAVWVAAVPFLFFAQCFQRLEVIGHHARRTGLRAVDLDLSTARVKATGRAWWIELFFLGRCLEIRDADGRGLLLESWLWSKGTRDAIVAKVRSFDRSASDGTGEASHS